MVIEALDELDSSLTAYNPNESMTVDEDEMKAKPNIYFFIWKNIECDKLTFLIFLLEISQEYKKDSGSGHRLQTQAA